MGFFKNLQRSFGETKEAIRPPSPSPLQDQQQHEPQEPAKVGTSSPGTFQGRHFTEYVDEVKALEKAGRQDEAEALLLHLVDATEAECALQGLGVAPWYYGRLAIIYRQQRRAEDELAILERFARQQHSPGAKSRELLKRLEKCRTASGIEKPESRFAGPRLKPAEDFLAAMHTFKRFDGSQQVEPDVIPRKRRSWSNAGFTSIPCPRRVPLLPKTLYFGHTMNTEQLDFYEAWKAEAQSGRLWQVEPGHGASYLIGFVYEYARELIAAAPADPATSAFMLEGLSGAYPKASDHLSAWAVDGWLLSGDIEGAIESFQPFKAGEKRSMQAERILTLRQTVGQRLDAASFFALYTWKVTNALMDRAEVIVEIAQARLDAEAAEGVEHLSELASDPALETTDWAVWNASTQASVVEGAPYARFSHLEAGQKLAAELQRAAEDEIRGDLGLPLVGQGWIGETQLFNELREAFDTEVIQHGIPAGFGQQHLDVWIPAWKVGVEYQGLQHFQPVDFFGGEKAFKDTVERDSRKAEKAQRLGIRIVYVRPDYELEEVIAQVKGCP